VGHTIVTGWNLSPWPSLNFTANHFHTNTTNVHELIDHRSIIIIQTFITYMTNKHLTPHSTHVSLHLGTWYVLAMRTTRTQNKRSWMTMTDRGLPSCFSAFKNFSEYIQPQCSPLQRSLVRHQDLSPKINGAFQYF